jgi:translation initiation factor IF-1
MRRFAKRFGSDSSGTRMRTDCSQRRYGHEDAEVHSWRVMKEATASFLGTVTEALRGDFFRVALDSGHSVLAKPAGKLQVHHIRLAVGDRVNVEISPYDPERGRIIQTDALGGERG